MKGLVIKNTGSWYTVLLDDGSTADCKVKGNFRLRGIRSTNPVAVGDRVTVAVPSPMSATGGLPAGSAALSPLFITEIEDRRNYIIRKSINLSKQSHILAANVDQALLVVTVSRPETSTTFIDRFLASAEAYRVPVVLIFNKTDLLSDEEQHYQQLMISLYETIGYECRAVSAETGMGIDELRPLLEGRITLLSGNSGVGKSTLINRLVPGANLRTAEISDAHQTGQHTTTFSEMIRLPDLPSTHLPSTHLPFTDLPFTDLIPNAEQLPAQPKSVNSKSVNSKSVNSKSVNSKSSWLIDTPGIKGFGTFDMEREELTSYFREIFEYSKQCRFSNCTHTHEPGCAVRQAVDDHYIAQSRYQSYLSMLDDKDENKYREAY
jgi:ribosome biogenesis GTPase